MSALNPDFDDTTFTIFKWLYIVLIIGRVVLFIIGIKKHSFVKVFHAYETFILMVTFMIPT